MAISTKISITIGGETLTRFSKLVIQQKVHTHHTFSVLQPLPKEFVSQAIDKAQSYIGEPIKIEITPTSLSTTSPFIFNGIITEAQMIRTSGAAGGIIINGYSPTIVMEGTPKTVSYTDQSLSDVVKQITSNYGQKELQPTVKVNHDSSMPYTVQYRESDFGFVARLAQKKGQWFYYNGEELVFGQPTSKNFTLEYGRSLHSFNIEMRTKPLGLEYLGYESSSAETQKANTSEINYQPEGYAKVAFERSKKLFPDNATMLYTHPIEEGSARTHLVDRVTTQLQSRAADLVTAKGDSDETGLRIGDVVSIQEPAFSLTGNLIDGLQEQNFGSYIITDITHVCEESGSYHNSFQAVPEDVMAPPYGNVHSHPNADTQTAIVTDNNDPAGLGRVQVKFAWQEDNTPWIRMTNPHAGSGKGMYFIPEIGEEVLVAFEAGNAEKPFVLGTMYNGNESSSYATSGNDKKVIQSRSGTKIIMNDAEGSIFIEDPSGNTWMMDGQGNISVNAPKNMSISVGENLDISVGNNMTTSIQNNNDTSVGANNTLSITELHRLSAKTYNQNIDENKTVKIAGDLTETTATTTHKAEQGDILFKSAGVAKILGAIDAKVNKG
ncbi:type VI secretion system tip protein VgrG [Flavobacterium gelidilacus]|uniref:type VI secretion system Vgr family protein n=1 Tax=Flavobacterium gelidilacus TaxID=206041 RepID=UPI0003F4D69A|nr:type VI secretion system tip protein VgrG [Flavobacterium gelidilacus]